jgi:hypothetical protein
MAAAKRARVEDIHQFAMAMPHVTRWDEDAERPI